jgi:hypothetical protein
MSRLDMTGVDLGALRKFLVGAVDSLSCVTSIERLVVWRMDVTGLCVVGRLNVQQINCSLAGFTIREDVEAVSLGGWSLPSH